MKNSPEPAVRAVKRWFIAVPGGAALAAYAWLAQASWQPMSVPALFLGLGVAWVATVVAFLHLRTSPGKVSLGSIVVWAVLFRIAGLIAQPVFEDDYYRFLWDGRMFAVHGTPYGAAPAASFGDVALPEDFELILNGINHPRVPTLYGPVFELAFLLGYRIAPASLWILKLLFIAADLGALWLMRRYLSRAGFLLWAWCPLLIQETAFSAHPDALGIVLCAAALAARMRGAYLPAAGWLAAACGARPFAVLLAPLILIPESVQWSRPADWKRIASGLAVFTAVAAALYLPFSFNGAAGAAGLKSFAASWEFNSSVYGLLQPLMGSSAAKTMGMLAVSCVVAVLVCRRPSLQVRGDLVFGALFLVSPVVNPWYLQWLLPFVAMRPSLWGVAALAAVSLSYATGGNLGLDSVTGFDHPVWVRPLEYGIIALAAGASIWRCYSLRRSDPAMRQ